MPNEPLSLDQEIRLQELEESIEEGLKTFIEVGNALLEIRDSKLYRQMHSTFEEYCRERWSMTDRRARQLINSVQVIGNLKTGTIVPLPSSESVARPLTGLKPEEQRLAWEEAVKTAPNGKVTVKHVAKIIENRDMEPGEPVQTEVGTVTYNPHDDPDKHESGERLNWVIDQVDKAFCEFVVRLKKTVKPRDHWMALDPVINKVHILAAYVSLRTELIPFSEARAQFRKELKEKQRKQKR